MDGFEKRRQQKKDAILKASLELFKEFGYNKVSVVEIAKKASVSQVSIYNFFESKENLKKELLKKLLKDHISSSLNILETCDSVKIKIENLILTRINFFKSFSSHFIIESIDSSTFTRETGMYLPKEYIDIKDYTILVKEVQKLFEEGKKEGIFNDSISTQAMMYYLEVFQNYLINNPSVIGEFERNSILSKELFSLFLYGIMKK
jgi:AcrR family transcriptional regulator